MNTSIMFYITVEHTILLYAYEILLITDPMPFVLYGSHVVFLKGGSRMKPRIFGRYEWIYPKYVNIHWVVPLKTTVKHNVTLYHRIYSYTTLIYKFI